MSRAGILDCIEAELPGRGIRLLAGSHGPAEDLGPARLLHLASLAAETFRSVGIGPGDRIVTLLPTGRPLLQAILGCWAAGAVISVVAPSVENGRSSLSLERLAGMLKQLRPKVIVAAEADFQNVTGMAATLGARRLTTSDLPTCGEPASRRTPNHADDIAFIQFTSGSTGNPKPIAIQHGQLLTNGDETAERLEFDSSCSMVSWLPLNHDLGFVLGLMMPLACGGRSVQIPTETFLRNPSVWLSSISKERATHSIAPPFACDLLAKPAYLRRLGDVDLTSLRYLVLGAEPVSWKTICEFEEAYASCGLRPGCLRAGFGMAEATLAVSSTGPFGTRRVAWVDREELSRANKVLLLPPKYPGALPLLSNGPPIGSIQVKIVDGEGMELEEGVQGRLLIHGPSVTKQYFGSEQDPQPGGWLDTGDLGFLLRGEVYISGRAKDVIIRGGAKVHPHELEEAAVRGLPGIAQRAVAFAVRDTENLSDRVVLGIELRKLPTHEGFPAQVRQIIARDVGVQVDEIVPLPRGAIPRTTSGKIQRSRAHDLYQAGQLVPQTEERAS